MRDIPEDYPACLTQVCNLQLYATHPTEDPTSCGAKAIDCLDWYVSPTRVSDYECHWGSSTVSLSACAVFRDPGRILPNAWAGPDGQTVITDWPPLELDTDIVATLRSRLVHRYDNDHDTACRALGEQLRIGRGSALVAVPDVVHICLDLGLDRALRFIADTAGPAGLSIAVSVLVDAAGLGSKFATFDSDCDQAGAADLCLDIDIFDNHLFGPSTRQDPAPEPLKVAANKCTALVQIAFTTLTRAQAQDKCATQPVLFVGGLADFGKEAAEHDLEVIGPQPELVQLEYMSEANKIATGKSRQWYNLVAYRTPCLNKTTAQHCDEYPFFTTVEGGPTAFDTYGSDVLKPISIADNTVEGGTLSALVTTAACGMQSAVGNPGSGGTKCLTVPLVGVPVASFFVCPKV